MNLTLSFLLLIFSLQVDSRSLEKIATIVRIRGTVTTLRPGQLQANVSKIGDVLLEDSSIVTGQNSFAQIRYDDGSIVNIGGNSKIIVFKFEDEGKVGMVSLLKGQLRAQVNKGETAERKTLEKFYVKTKTAALGVRGTDFHLSYNPVNLATTLLTYEGKVALAKVEGKSTREITAEEITEKDGRALVKERLEKFYQGEKLSTKEMHTLLATKKTVEVPAGQFSASYHQLDLATESIKISPVQFTALANNLEFQKKATKNFNTDPKSLLSYAPQSEQKAPPEGNDSTSTGRVALRSGGYLDLSAGVYVPPLSTSPFNPRQKVFEAQESVGLVDVETGEYIAPKGMKLSETKGFILDEEYLKAASDKDRILIASTQKNLNLNLNSKIIPGAEASKTSLSAVTFPERFLKNQLALSFLSGKKTVQLEGDTRLDDQEFEIPSVNQFSLKVSMPLRDSFLFETIFSGAVAGTPDYNNLSLSSETTSTSRFYSMGAGLSYLPSVSWAIGLLALWEQDPVVGSLVEDSSTVLHVKQFTSTKLQLSFQRRLFTRGRFLASSRFHLLGILSGKKGDIQTDTGMGFGLDLELEYWLRQNSMVKFNLLMRQESQDLTIEGSSSTNKRSIAGAGLSLHYFY